MSIASNLRQLRLNSGMTQEQVAEKIGLTRQALSSYESGRTRPDIDMLLRLSEVYGTDIEGVVYGQARTLQSLRIVKRISALMFAVIAALTAVSSALLWSANRFYAITEGQLSAEEKFLLESRVHLTTAWETVDAVILAISLIGFLIVLVLLAVWKCKIPLKTKLIYIAALTVTLLAVVALFGIADIVFAPINYLLTPLLVIARIVVLLVIHLIIELIQKRMKKRGDKAC